jgi:DNA polymerase
MPEIKKINFLKDIIGIETILSCEKIIINDNATDEFESLKNKVMKCKNCRLSKTRTHIVFGEGNTKARLMFVGEGPGYDEDKMGRPFVGKAGILLDKIINAMTLTRNDVYIANIVKCRPPGNRNPLNDEIKLCIGYLHKQIELINPELIVCLGSVATCALLDIKGSITKMRGNFHQYKNIKVMPTFHPAYLLRNEQMKKFVWEDMKMVMNELNLKR